MFNEFFNKFFNEINGLIRDDSLEGKPKMYMKGKPKTPKNHSALEDTTNKYHNNEIYESMQQDHL